ITPAILSSSLKAGIIISVFIPAIAAMLEQKQTGALRAPGTRNMTKFTHRGNARRLLRTQRTESGCTFRASGTPQGNCNGTTTQRMIAETMYRQGSAVREPAVMA